MLATACAGPSAPSNSSEPVATVTLGAPSSSLAAGQTIQLSVTLRDASGNVVTGRAVTWTSSADTTLTVSSAGRATGVLPGTATVTATSEGKSGSVALTVTTPVLSADASGITGYFYGGLSAQPAGFTYGFSTFAEISTLNPDPAAGTQLGWGTWIIPNNLTFNNPLCPVGTVARDNWPDRGPSYRDVYQTIEGGPGQWTSTRFPSPSPKFRINSTPDCYTNEVASTGWSFYQSALPANRLGLAQLSNRLLVPPDGFTLSGAASPAILGYGWLALPLIPAGIGTVGLPVGDQSWTLFLDAADFAGPVAFFTPDLWTQVAATDQTGAGRGLDARPAITSSLALEIGNAPMFTGQDHSGTRYRRIPRLTFPAEAGSRQAILHQHVRYYAKSAFWDAVANWIDNGVAATQMDPAGVVAPTIAGPGISLRLGGDPTDLTALVSAVVPGVAGGGQGWGVQWTAAGELGVLPEYFRNVGGTWTAVPASAVPRETWLADQTFPAAPRSAPAQLDLSTSSPWTPAKWAAGPFTVSLGDGSAVDYVWYRFVDQPAIARLGLSAAVTDRLQAFAESLHEHYGVQGVTIEAPTAEALATLDPALIVTPPAGLEKGYVPVVIRQH